MSAVTVGDRVIEHLETENAPEYVPILSVLSAAVA
jgi:hypothetical protein